MGLSVETTSGELFGLAVLSMRDTSPERSLMCAALDACGLTAGPDTLSWRGGLAVDSATDGVGCDTEEDYVAEWETLALSLQQAVEEGCRRHPAGRVLDIGCGTGRFMRILAARGYAVTGVDTSALLVWLCRHDGFTDVHRLSAAELSGAGLGKFPIQLLLGHNLGIGGDPAGVQALLRECRGQAAPGGILLADSLDIGHCREVFAARRRAWHAEHPGRHPGQTEYTLRFGPVSGLSFPWIHLSPEDCRDLASECGWRMENIFTQSDGSGHWAGLLTAV